MTDISISVDRSLILIGYLAMDRQIDIKFDRRDYPVEVMYDTYFPQKVLDHVIKNAEESIGADGGMR